MNKVNLSIVIPSYNTKKLLTDCLQSIEGSKSSMSYEIIVVDNASSDGSQDMVRSKFPKTILIRNKKNKGFACAVNQGWKIAKGEYVLFLNSDTIVQDNSLEVLLNYLQDEPEAGAVSGKLTLRDGNIDLDTHRGFPSPWSSLTFFLGLENIFPKSKLFSQYHQGWKDLNNIHEIDAGSGALLMVVRKVLEEVNGWDEGYFFYGEDIDLCYRIKQRGYKIFFHPGTKVMHYKGASSGLRKESKDIARPTRENLIRVTKGSIDAWKKFYIKFYQDKYPNWVTWLVLSGIQAKGFIRLFINSVKPI